MKIHLFGLPISLHRKLKQESEDWRKAVPDGHNFRATPIYSNELAPLSQSELREIESAVDDGFTHIVLPASRNWGAVKAHFQFDCRVHVARLRNPLRDLTWPILQQALHDMARLDEEWLERFCPTEIRHPLLLPPKFFVTEKATADFWNKCDAYSRERFAAASGLLEEVERVHRRPDGKGKRNWVDGRGWRYRIDPSMHAPAAKERAGRKSFRFCFEVPPGFHYDVTHDKEGYFRIEIDRRTQSVKHCNITPWGKVRLGKQA